MREGDDVSGTLPIGEDAEGVEVEVAVDVTVGDDVPGNKPRSRSKPCLKLFVLMDW